MGGRNCWRRAPGRGRSAPGYGPFSEALVGRLCGDTTRFAEHVEFAFVDDAAHFITDDAPGEVAELTLDFFNRLG